MRRASAVLLGLAALLQAGNHSALPGELHGLVFDHAHAGVHAAAHHWAAATHHRPTHHLLGATAALASALQASTLIRVHDVGRLDVGAGDVAFHRDVARRSLLWVIFFQGRFPESLYVRFEFVVRLLNAADLLLSATAGLFLVLVAAQGVQAHGEGAQHGKAAADLLLGAATSLAALHERGGLVAGHCGHINRLVHRALRGRGDVGLGTGNVAGLKLLAVLGRGDLVGRDAAVGLLDLAALLHAADVLDAVAVFVGLLLVAVDVAVNRGLLGLAASLAGLAVGADVAGLSRDLAAGLERAAADRAHARLGVGVERLGGGPVGRIDLLVLFARQLAGLALHGISALFCHLIHFAFSMESGVPVAFFAQKAYTETSSIGNGYRYV